MLTFKSGGLLRGPGLGAEAAPASEVGPPAELAPVADPGRRSAPGRWQTASSSPPPSSSPCCCCSSSDLHLFMLYVGRPGESVLPATRLGGRGRGETAPPLTLRNEAHDLNDRRGKESTEYNFLN